MRLLGVFAPLILSAYTATIAAAQVTLDDGASGVIRFRGAIDQPSVAKLSQALIKWRPRAGESPDSRPAVEIKSEGGDVDAALLAGRALRAARATVLVFGASDRPQCSSACVLLLAGAVERVLVGGIGVHNFYVASETATYDQVLAARRRLEREILAFLQEMNVSRQLYDRMLSEPPRNLRRLLRLRMEPR